MRRLAVPLALVLGALAWSSPAMAQDPTSDTVPTEPIPSTLTSALDTAFAKARDDGYAPGAQAVVLHDGKLIWSGNIGSARVETSERREVPVDSSTWFYLASFGKQILATFTLSLVEQGELQLDVPISTYVGNAVPGADVVTVRMLLNHTASYPDGGIDSSVPLPNLRRCWTTTCPPGSTYSYSNAGYEVLHRVLEHVTGNQLVARMEAFLGRVGISNGQDDGTSVLTMRRSQAAVRHHAYGYRNLQSGPTHDYGTFTENADIFGSQMYGQHGAVLFAGTALGGARFLDSLFVQGRLLKPGTLDQMLTAHPSSGEFNYGLGTYQERPGVSTWTGDEAAGTVWQGHNGTAQGFTTAGFTDRKSGVTIFVTANLWPLPGKGAWPAMGLFIALADVLVPKQDIAAPETVASVDGQGGDGRFRGPVTVKLAASDGPYGSGVGAIEHRLAGDAQWQPYTRPIVASDLGTHRIEYRSRDRSGNVEATRTATFEIVAPTVEPGHPVVAPPSAVLAPAPVAPAKPKPARRPTVRTAAASRTVRSTRLVTLANVTCQSGPCRIAVGRVRVRIAGRSYTAIVSGARNVHSGARTVLRARLSAAAGRRLAQRGARGTVVAPITVRYSGGAVTQSARLTLKR